MQGWILTCSGRSAKNPLTLTKPSDALGKCTTQRHHRSHWRPRWQQHRHTSSLWHCHSRRRRCPSRRPWTSMHCSESTVSRTQRFLFVASRVPLQHVYWAAHEAELGTHSNPDFLSPASDAGVPRTPSRALSARAAEPRTRPRWVAQFGEEPELGGSTDPTARYPPQPQFRSSPNTAAGLSAR